MDHREAYAKPALTFDEPLDRLTERGIQALNRDHARRPLAHLNVHRRCTCWLPLKDGPASHVSLSGERLPAHARSLRERLGPALVALSPGEGRAITTPRTG